MVCAAGRRRAVNAATALTARVAADFGFARPLEKEKMAETLCGSPLYMVGCSVKWGRVICR